MDVLTRWKQSWESKIVATGVADFEGAATVPPRSRRNNQSSQANSGASASKINQNGVNAILKVEDGVNSSTPSGNKIARTNGSSDVKGEAGSSTVSSATGGQSLSSAAAGSAVGAMAIQGLLSSNGDHGGKRKRPAGTDENEIGSDLDDSDEEELDGTLDADGNEDMILCLYDKVQRVRNKWKCTLRDGVASIDGRDYVFSKLASELEW